MSASAFVEPDDRLSPHFTAREFAKSATASRLGIDNRIPTTLHAQASRTCEQLEKVRAILGVPMFLLSGWRCPQLNVAVGGSPTSDHRHCRAVDFRAPGFGSPTQIVRRLEKALQDGELDFDQLILEFPNRGEGAWVHIGFRSNIENRKQILTKKDGQPYRVGIHP